MRDKPLLERGRDEALWAAQACHVHASVGLLHEPLDLLLRVPAVAHRASARARRCFFISWIRGPKDRPT
jgi:hypothetical protein